MTAPTRTVWLRAGYAVPGRLPRCQVTHHAVSEMVAVEAAMLTDAEAQPVPRVMRPGTLRDESDADCVAEWAGMGPAGEVVQRFEVRRGPDGLLCPVFGPDGVTPVTVADLDRLERLAAALQTTPTPRHGMWDGPPAWASYPGAVPCPIVASYRAKPPAPRPGAPGRSPWALPELSASALVNVDEGARWKVAGASGRVIGGAAQIAFQDDGILAYVLFPDLILLDEELFLVGLGIALAILLVCPGVFVAGAFAAWARSRVRHLASRRP